MTKTKSKSLAEFISENSNNPRRLWNSINNILHRIPPPALSEFKSVKSLCDHFSWYFVDKIETIRFKFPDKAQNIPQLQKKQKLDPKWTFLNVCQKREIITGSGSRLQDLGRDVLMIFRTSSSSTTPKFDRESVPCSVGCCESTVS